jgi:HSP20 family protein
MTMIVEVYMNPLTRYEPLVNELDGLFNDFFRPAFVLDNRVENARIRVDVKETADAYTVQAEIPGVKKEDIAVEIEGNEVTIAAEVKRETQAKEGEKWLRTERFHGKAGRRFALPQEIDEAKANAKFADGVLELSLPKKQAAAGRKVAVQ